MKRVAILQSNYIPWKGYFDLIASVDEFILYDDMQYTRRDWRNRNQIKTSQGLQWLTIPVLVKGKYHQKILETEVAGSEWMKDHWKAIEQNYKKAPYFSEISDLLRDLYSGNPGLLSDVNRKFIERICGYLKIRTKISTSSEFRLREGKTERLVDVCVQAGASTYVSGPAARDYVDESLFSERGIDLHWFEYSNYPEYPQLWGAFAHNVSIIDLLFNCGPSSPKYMRHVAE